MYQLSAQSVHVHKINVHYYDHVNILTHYSQSRIAPSELVDKHRYLDQSFDHNGFRPGIGVERIRAFSIAYIPS